MAALGAWAGIERAHVDLVQHELATAKAGIAQYKAQVAARAAQQEARNAQIVAQHDQAAADVAAAYRAQIAKLRNGYHAKTSVASRIQCGIARLRGSAAGSAGRMRTTSAGASIADGAPRSGVAPVHTEAAVSADVTRLPEQCAEDAAQILKFQEWARAVGEASR